MMSRLLLYSALVCLFIHMACPAGAELHRVVLPNNVRLVLRPVASADLVAISICVRTEPDRSPAEDAAAEIVARSLFSSSLNRSHASLSASISEVGGTIETVRTAEHVDITCVALPAQVREAVYLLCEVLKNTDFAAMERTRDGLIAEQKRGGSGIPGGLDILRRELQGRPDLSDLPYSRVTRAQVSAYFQSRYVPERTAIAVVGRFDLQSVQTALRDSLADFDRTGARAIRSGPLYGHATNFPTRVLKQPGASGYALVATPAPSLSDRDYPAFMVLKSILGEGHASRLFQRLRDAQGIGYNVGASWQTSLSDPLVAYLQWEARTPADSGAAPGAPAARAGSGQVYDAAPQEALTPEAALRLLSEQVDSLLSGPPSEAEVERGRNIAIGREALRHERTRDRAFLLAWYEAMGVGAEFDDGLPARLAAVTRADVMRVAHDYLSLRASVLIVPEP